MRRKDMEREQYKLERTIEQIKDYTYYLSDFMEKKRNQLRTGTNMVGDLDAYQRSNHYKKMMGKAVTKPYFGRFDINTKDEGYEKFYIGKHGVSDKETNIVVVDWRMPIASVYYNFMPGSPTQQYVVEDEKNRNKIKHEVEVLKKKEFTIKDQRIIKILQQVSEAESDANLTMTESGEELTVTDDFLREIIENSETTGYLKEIIATIQKEQDQAIREPIDKDLIIQGVAGSGKSSIALHRISFLLFNNKLIKPKDILILGPSNLFISSVKDLLPDLELEHISQSTVQDLMLDAVKPYIKSIDEDLTVKHYFEDLLFEEGNETEQKIIAFKGSRDLVEHLDIFIDEYSQHYETRIKPIEMFTHTLSSENLLEIYKGYQYLPFIQRVEKFIQHVKNHFHTLMEKELKELQKHNDFVVSEFLAGSGLSMEDRKKFADKAVAITKYKTDRVKDEFRRSFSEWKAKVQVPDLLTIYRQFLSYEVLRALAGENSQVPGLFRNYTLKKISYFDLAPLYYIYASLYNKPVQYTHIVVDEAQDLSFAHFAGLKKMTKTMTVLGDKDQSIFMEYGQRDWDQLRNSVFNTVDSNLLKLDTSYRSTKEIIDAANQVLSNSQGVLHVPITPLNRSGERVSVSEVSDGKDLINRIANTLTKWSNKYKRIAVIHKTEQKAKKFAELLNKSFPDDIAYVDPHQEVGDNKISVLASYHAKGMEFDAVILVNVNEESFPKNELHSKLLYVLLTRAQQEVKVFYNGEPSGLLEGLVEKQPQPHSIYDEIL